MPPLLLPRAPARLSYAQSPRLCTVGRGSAPERPRQPSRRPTRWETVDWSCKLFLPSSCVTCWLGLCVLLWQVLHSIHSCYNCSYYVGQMQIRCSSILVAGLACKDLLMPMGKRSVNKKLEFQRSSRILRKHASYGYV